MPNQTQKPMFKVPEQYRAKFTANTQFYSDETYGNNGIFYVSLKNKIQVIASDGKSWDHISVNIRLQNRTPRRTAKTAI